MPDLAVQTKQMNNTEQNSWWKNAVGYQIYPRSFKDSNHDGIGDLNGIRQKLPYLKELGIDFIWINPIYTSPNVDNGYDISDYQAIHEDFGTMDDFQDLLKEAHELGLKIIMDLVINHTSDQHPWFLESKKSLDNPYRDYYHWADATKEQLPNNWQSFFGGSTWTYDEKTKQAYFHVFAKEQPDLNWKNPHVRHEIYQMIRWWLDLGIDGFRIDAISHIQKEPWDFQITDNQWAPFMNVTGIESYLKELKAIFNEYNVMTVGEASGVPHQEAGDWTGDNGYFNMIFELEHCERIGEIGKQKGSIPHLKHSLNQWQTSLSDNGWNALYLENHDTPRSVSVYGDDSPEAAKALATVLLLLKGTPFIYQGQEVGMTNYPFRSIDEINAADTIHFYQTLLTQGKMTAEALAIAVNWSRDHSRTPFQWEDALHGGFSTTEPWLKVNENYRMINAAQKDLESSSIFHHYQALIRLRKQNDALINGKFQLLFPEHPTIFSYTRTTETESWLILVQLDREKTTISFPDSWNHSDWEEVLTTVSKKSVKQHMILSDYEAHVYRKVTR
ncbi:alpha-glucosidase [Enterococcus sp. DIV0212c]|uniref:glycoside hydrolase family 13 protein n=1 Tax=Enterococcus sp. DIV0212c TaxID=2230867 RepID=UPI001A9BDFB9|nr:alpha-glucosidase [Enterococcus sp. DIV0212c]MBO1353189.1 alpha-glucosidase [Enterococcus sp. DIV0212c]